MIPLLEKIEGCLVGLSIGDSMGFPFETCSQQEISDILGGQVINRYVSPQQKNLGDTGEEPFMLWKDPLATSLNMFESYIGNVESTRINN